MYINNNVIYLMSPKTIYGIINTHRDNRGGSGVVDAEWWMLSGGRCVVVVVVEGRQHCYHSLLNSTNNANSASTVYCWGCQ